MLLVVRVSDLSLLLAVWGIADMNECLMSSS